MPYKKSKRTFTRKLKKLDYATKKVGKLSQARAINPYRVKSEPFPRVLYTRCKYMDSLSITPTVQGQAAKLQFKINDLYDPSSIGQSVAGLPELTNLYTSYIVMNCKVIVDFSAPTQPGSTVGVRLRVGTGGSTNAQTVLQLGEQPMTYMNTVSNTGARAKNFTFNIKPWTLIGISKIEYLANSSKYASAIDSAPTTLGYIDCFHVNQFTALPAAPNPSITCQIKMIFDAKFYDRKYLTTV